MTEPALSNEHPAFASLQQSMFLRRIRPAERDQLPPSGRAEARYVVCNPAGEPKMAYTRTAEAFGHAILHHCTLTWMH